MKNKKILIVIATIAIIVILAECINIVVRKSKINKYTKADEYVVSGEKIPSVKSSVG